MASLNQTAHPIHAVITWVDGNAPKHQELRARYQVETEAIAPLSENASNPHRWADNDELSFCLRSIHNHAPWIDTIWIVTSGETADLSALPEALQAKIKYAFHDEIFAGLEKALPTFNSLAIESLLWRIEGLSEHFIYFNDDVFLTATLEPSDIFSGEGHPVLRGAWRDFSHVTPTSEHADDPAYLNHYVQTNAAALAGYGSQNLFSTAHVAHPMQRSVFADLFETHRGDFAKNASHRFRDISQFSAQSLHNHQCIAKDEAAFVEIKDHFHVFSFYGDELPENEVRRDLETGLRNAKFLCVNDLPELEKKVPNIREWLEAAIAKK